MSFTAVACLTLLILFVLFYNRMIILIRSYRRIFKTPLKGNILQFESES